MASWPGRRAPAWRCTTSGRRETPASPCTSTRSRARPISPRPSESYAASSRPWPSGDHTPETLRRYGETQARLEHGGGYGWRDHATAVLRGLGFADADLDRGLDTFSGGELTRASLARALAGNPDLLLLDEPTNHLDMASIEWLEQELSTIDAAVILVAHDRWFLESVATSVLELEEAARPSSPASGTSGARRRPHGSPTRRSGPSARQRTSRGSSASSPASGTGRSRARPRRS